MRIWVMTHEYSSHVIGGLGIVATQLSQFLGKLDGLDVMVLTTGKVWNMNRKKNPGVIRIPRYLLKEPQAVWERLKTEGISLPDLIHIHSVQYGKLAAFFKKLGVPILYTCHSLVCLEKRKNSSFEKEQIRLLHMANKIVAPSNWLRREMTNIYPRLADKTIVIHNGILPFSAKPGFSPLNKLAFIGRLIPAKGIDQLIEALPILNQINAQVTLDIYGTGSKKFINDLKKIVQKHQLEEKVTWHGFIKHEKMREILPTLGAVVMPSKNESFGLVALEALASGVPLVSTCVGGLTEFLSSQVAEIIQEVQPASIASAIFHMWSQPEVTNLRVQKGLMVARDYTWDTIAWKYRSTMEGMN
jgi:glycogen(starch) synthase